MVLLDLFAPGRNPITDQILSKPSVLFPLPLTLILSITVRLALGLLNAYALTHVSTSLRRAFGTTEARIFTLFMGSQFHVCWWAGRTVPNMMAMVGSEFSLRAVPLCALGWEEGDERGMS